MEYCLRCAYGDLTAPYEYYSPSYGGGTDEDGPSVRKNLQASPAPGQPKNPWLLLLESTDFGQLRCVEAISSRRGPLASSVVARC